MLHEKETWPVDDMHALGGVAGPLLEIPAGEACRNSIRRSQGNPTGGAIRFAVESQFELERYAIYVTIIGMVLAKMMRFVAQYSGNSKHTTVGIYVDRMLMGMINSDCEAGEPK